MRTAILVPGADYPELWDWAFEVEADALKAGHCTVDAIPWTDVADVSHYDLVLPLVAWGYHLDYARRSRAMADGQSIHAPAVEQ
jgi:hypothetical protein